MSIAFGGTRVEMNRENIRQVLHDRGGPVHREVASITRKVLAVAQINAPVDKGPLRQSGRSEVNDIGTAVVGRVEFTADYALYVHEGTGIYGRGVPITPKRGKYLVFRGRDGSLVFAKSVKGSPARPFLVDALKAVSPWPVRVLS